MESVMGKSSFTKNRKREVQIFHEQTVLGGMQEKTNYDGLVN